MISAAGTLSDESSRSVSIRYFNLYRVVVASILAILIAVSEEGEYSASPTLRLLVAVYWSLGVLFTLLPGQRRGQNTVLFLQVGVDVLVLTTFMYFAGGSRSGIPYLLMTTIAGAALVSEGRLVIGFAAMATLAVLAEQVLHVFKGSGEVGDFTRTGMTCAGFFAVALLARLLAKRALANEELARARGAALTRQMQVNASVIRDMQDGVVVVDGDGRVRQSNPAAAELLGELLYPGHPVTEVSPALARAASSEGAGLPTFLSASGRTVRVRAVAAETEQDRILYLEDMDRVQAQAQQIKLAALGRLTANIAHEIRNPLSSISHASELMAEEKRADVQARLQRIIHDNAARIERIVYNVLELGRRDRVTPEAIDLEAFMRGFTDEGGLLPDRKACLRWEVPEDLVLCFDRLHLHQILSNLIGNALRHGSGKPGCVRVTARAMDESEVLLAVQDDGPGIPAEDRSKIFEPFFTSDPQGNGLGLYIARELAEANGARLVLADRAGGAEFHLFARSDA